MLAFTLSDFFKQLFYVYMMK